MRSDAERPVKVLFVVGMARSGSTLLTMLLDRVEGLVGLGEAHVYWDLVGSGRRCGCGGDLDSECPLWSGLGRSNEARDVDVGEMRRAFHDFVRPRPRSLLRRLVARRGGADGARAARYGVTMGATYRWLAEHTDADVLIDSTKLPAAPELTAASPDVDVRVVHLVRDPRAVAHSLARRQLADGRRRPGRGERVRYLRAVLRATLDWTLRNAYVELKLRRRSGNWVRLRFEDLTRDPRASVASLLALVGVDPSDADFLGQGAFDADENHILTGDDARFRRGRIPIRPQEAWREEMPGYARLVATAIVAPLLGRLAYPPRFSAAAEL